MAYGRSITFELLRSLAAAGGNILTTYKVLANGSLTVFGNRVRGLSIVNATDQILIISYDGVNDHDALPSGSGRVWDFTTNHGPNTDTPFFAIGGGVYARYPAGGTQPTTGSVYAMAFYCLGD